ncbi:MAG TPA: helix-turn-helix domain-containing protein [Acidimicrobiales bacterium]|nr:helix-turn-helix domain-containing protein [Acidimicrobiales bacterium]
MVEPDASDRSGTQLLLTPEQAARALAIGRTKLYSLIARGVIASVKVDGCRRVPVRAVEAYVDQLLRERNVG